MVVCTEVNDEVERLHYLLERVNSNLPFADFEIEESVQFYRRLNREWSGRFIPDNVERCYMNFEALRHALGPRIMNKYMKDAEH